MAMKPDKKRGKHPKNGTPAFDELRTQRSCRERAATEEERKEITAERKRRWKRKHRVLAQKEAVTSLPLADLIARRVEMVLERLRYVNARTHLLSLDLLLLISLRSDIQDPEIIVLPKALCDYPSFPELAFHYLPLQLCINDHRECPTRNPSKDLGVRQYYRLRKSRCPPEMLDMAWSKWEKLREYTDGETQRNRLFAIAKDLKARRDLYGAVLKGMESGTDQERATFHDVWFNKGLAEIKSILDTGVTLAELRWNSFKELETLYHLNSIEATEF
jgi:hypothetical protein